MPDPTRNSAAEKAFTPNAKQREIIDSTEGPMLVIAGPGTGKTATMVARIENLILNKGVKPEQIMVLTYTTKAAKELVSRISKTFFGNEPPVNTDKMLIGTFHSICLRILREYAPESGLKNIRISNDFDLRFRIRSNREFEEKLYRCNLFKTAWGKPNSGFWLIKNFVSFVDTAKEEQVSVDKMRKSGDPDLIAAAGLLEEYERDIQPADYLSFADLQVKVMELLDSNERVLEDLRNRIRYIIVDEYQDTNHIQERIVLKLAGEMGNVCAVGDDDQSLYRFRGASVQNILQFETNFSDDKCMVRELSTNYRSHPKIIEFGKKWMESTRYGTDLTAGFDWVQDGARMRREKALEAGREFPDADSLQADSVVSCTGEDEADWHEQVFKLIERIKAMKGFKDLNQIAFICNSVKNKTIVSLISYLEDERNIPVYSPRSGLFLSRNIVGYAIGCLIRCFDGTQRYAIDPKEYEDDLCLASRLLENDKQFASWVREKQRYFSDKKKVGKVRDKHSLLSLFYEMMQFEPFKSCLDEATPANLASTMPARNLAILATLMERLEASLNADGKYDWTDPAYAANRFFNKYLPSMREDESLWEYEDDEEKAPSGHVSFLTIHQAKGMEFPVVVVCSLFESVLPSAKTLNDRVRDLESGRTASEPHDCISHFDYWRKYYTAFSRAQDLLVLADSGAKNLPLQPQFKELYGQLPDFSSAKLDHIRLSEVEKPKIMHTYAFTSDISAYAKCPQCYRLQKKLGFPAAAGQSELFGLLVHQSIEDIHRIVKRKGANFIPKKEVYAIVEENCASLQLVEHTELKGEVEKAFDQVMNYLVNSKNLWQNVLHAELDLSDVRQLANSPRGGYILKGKIDLVADEHGDTVIVDFKTGTKPREGDYILARYRDQLKVYAHLLSRREEVDGNSITSARLYFTGGSERKGKSEGSIIEEPVERGDITEIIDEFDSTVEKIEACDFEAEAEDRTRCRNCSFGWYCGKR